MGVALGAVALVVAAIAYPWYVLVATGRQGQDALRVWHEIEPPPTLSSAQMQALGVLVRAAYAGRASPLDAVQALSGVSAEHGLWVTAWRRNGGPVRAGGVGPELSSTLSDVTATARVGAEDVRRVQVDLAGPAVPVQRRLAHRWLAWTISEFAPDDPEPAPTRPLLRQLVYEVEPGHHGLSLEDGERRAALLPLDPLTHGQLAPRVRHRDRKLRALLLHLSRQAGGPGGLWERPGVRLARFRTRTLLVGLEPGPVVPVGAALTPIDGPGAPDDDALYEALIGASSWLARQATPGGRFDYDLSPVSGIRSDDYNAVHHAGVVAGLLEIRAATGLVAAEQAAHRGQRWLDEHLRRPEGAGDGALAVIDDDGHVRAGASGFALVALLDQGLGTGDARVAGLLRHLASTVDEQGRVATEPGDPDPEQHPWFPGIVLLALARAHEALGDEPSLTLARSISRARVAEHQAGRAIPDHWTIQGLVALWRSTGDETLLDAANDMALRYLPDQYTTANAPYPHYVGGFRSERDTPRAIRAASRCEAIGAVVLADRSTGRSPGPLAPALEAAAAHVIVQLHRPSNSWYVEQPDEIAGALRLGMLDGHLRIDANKHAARCLLRAWQGRGAPGPAPTPPP